MNTESGTHAGPGQAAPESARERGELLRPQPFLLALAEALRSLGDPQAIRAEAARRLGTHLRADRAFYAEVESQGEAFLAFDYCGEGVPKLAGRYPLDDFGTAAADALRAGHIVAVPDIEKWDALTDAEKQRCRQLRIRALLEVPLVKDGRLTAFLALHQSGPRHWTADEEALATDVAERTWAIVERAKAEEALRESERKYRVLFESMTQTFCEAELVRDARGHAIDYRLLQWNSAFERLTGIPPDARIGKRMSDVGEIQDRWLEVADRVVRSGHSEYVEYEQPETGHWRSAHVYAVNGDRFIALGEDITDHKRVDVTTKLLAAIVESSDDAMIREDLDGIIQTWNVGAERMFGYAAREVIGKPFAILMPSDRVDEGADMIARIRSGRRVDHYETVRRRKDGSLLDVSITVSPIVDHAGRVVAASKIARDITQRKRAEAVARENDARHRLLLKLGDASRDGIDAEAVGTASMRILAGHMRVDRCCVAYLLRDEDRARPGPEYRCGDLPSLFGSAGELRLSDFPVCMQRLENESVAIGDVARDPTLGEGERAAILAMRGMGALLAAPLRLGEGNRVWALVVGQAGPRAWTDAEVRLVEDVAERTCAAMERARTEAALREREAELERANRAKDEFIAMLSHELRNPLAPIATTLQLMKLREPDVLVRERGVIEDQVQHLAGMVDDLLDVARIANGKLELKRERLEVGQLVAAAVDATRAAMEGRRQSLHMHVEDGLIVSGDRRRLVQVLVNLLANATKYSPPDRNIWLTATGEGDEAVLRVRDEGQGIAADVLPRVFESFIQDTHLLDRSRGGLGLGLAIVHNLVALHGGSVTAASEGRYKGSEFTVRLPLLERVREPGAVSNESETADATSPGREAERIKVLIVDDYAPAADSLALLLQEMGYRTHVVHDGGAALEAIKTFEPQVALIDIGLPVIDGYEVAQTVRRMPGRDKLPLIAVTGYGQASDHERVMEAGFDEHVVKPLDAARISELIEKMMTAG